MGLASIERLRRDEEGHNRVDQGPSRAQSTTGSRRAGDAMHHPTSTIYQQTPAPTDSETRTAPARRLIAAMIIQAWDDIALGGAVKQSAWAWVYEGRRQQAWSFDWCCEVIGVDPNAVRDSIESNPRRFAA